jgi:hypothetical protein
MSFDACVRPEACTAVETCFKGALRPDKIGPKVVQLEEPRQGHIKLYVFYLENFEKYFKFQRRLLPKPIYLLTA